MGESCFSSCGWFVPSCLLPSGLSNLAGIRGKEGASQLSLIIFLILLQICPLQIYLNRRAKLSPRLFQRWGNWGCLSWPVWDHITALSGIQSRSPSFSSHLPSWKKFCCHCRTKTGLCALETAVCFSLVNPLPVLAGEKLCGEAILPQCPSISHFFIFYCQEAVT